jgi:hypothetical protein
MKAKKASGQANHGPGMAFFLHDLYNILCVAVVVILDSYYLFKSTDWDLIGTNMLGETIRPMFDFMWYFFAVYMVIDTLWVYSMPHVAAAGATPIIIHHILTLIYIMVPFYIPQFHWHTGVVLLVETNTFLLTLRRNVVAESLLFQIINILFLITWILMRLVLFPCLCVFFYFEWHRYSADVGTFANLFVLGLVMQILLTGMGLKWTYDLAGKYFPKSDKSS